MPTVDQYAASIVDQYQVAVGSGSAPHKAADEVIPLLKQWGRQHLVGITLSGAYAKNTAISLSSHVDVLISLSPVPGLAPGSEMKQIFWGLFEYLTDQDLRPHTRNVSMQLQVRGLNVDLIPACKDKATGGNVLFNKKTGAAVITDLARHVHLVANSGRQQEICALKIWRERAKLDFPSFYLELTALEALKGERFGQLADNVIVVMRYLANRFEQVTVCDPANEQNVVSIDLSADAKKAIAKAARAALYDENWKKMMW